MCLLAFPLFQASPSSLGMAEGSLCVCVVGFMAIWRWAECTIACFPGEGAWTSSRSAQMSGRAVPLSFYESTWSSSFSPSVLEAEWKDRGLRAGCWAHGCVISPVGCSSDFSEKEALNGTEDLAPPFLYIHPRFYPFSSLMASWGGSRGRISLCSPSCAHTAAAGRRGSVGLCLLPTSCPWARDSRGAGTGSWPCRAAGQGRVCFCAGHKERSPGGTKRVKSVSVKALGLAGLGSSVSRLPPQPGSLPFVSRALPRAPPRWAGLPELRLPPTANPSLCSSLNNRGVEGIYTSAW